MSDIHHSIVIEFVLQYKGWMHRDVIQLNTHSQQPNTMNKVKRGIELKLKTYSSSFQLIVAFCITSLVAAQPQGPGPYGPEKFAPQPYSYQYGVADDYSKANFQKTESQDASVRVKKQTVILFLNLCF